MLDSQGARRQGLLIVFEGIDGTGKSTQISLLADRLRGIGHEVVETFEPTKGRYGKKIREMRRCREALGPAAELALFVDDRREHVQSLIGPALAAGKLVLCDRYLYSTLAYQGAAGHSLEKMLKMHKDFAPTPHLVLLFVAPPSLGLKRVRESRKEGLDDFEKEDYLHKVADIFASFQSENICRIDASADMETVAQAVWQPVLGLLDSKTDLKPLTLANSLTIR